MVILGHIDHERKDINKLFVVAFLSRLDGASVASTCHQRDTSVSFKIAGIPANVTFLLWQRQASKYLVRFEDNPTWEGETFTVSTVNHEWSAKFGIARRSKENDRGRASAEGGGGGEKVHESGAGVA